MTEVKLSISELRVLILALDGYIEQEDNEIMKRVDKKLQEKLLQALEALN